MRCSHVFKKTLDIYVRLTEDLTPIYDFAFYWNQFPLEFWQKFEEFFSVRYDQCEDPKELLLALIASMNDQLPPHVRVYGACNDEY